MIHFMLIVIFEMQLIIKNNLANFNHLFFRVKYVVSIKFYIEFYFTFYIYVMLNVYNINITTGTGRQIQLVYYRIYTVYLPTGIICKLARKQRKM